jgi:hypothetical protein
MLDADGPEKMKFYAASFGPRVMVRKAGQTRFCCLILLLGRGESL